MKKVYNIMFPPLLVFLLISCLSLVFCDSAFSHEAFASPATLGGISDNPFTSFDGGNGAGMCPIKGMPNYWVNTSTRQMVVQDTDFSYSGLGPAIAMTRTYNMPRYEVYSGMFGKSWNFSYESTIDHSGQSLTYKEVYLKKGSGQTLTYQIDISKTPPVQAIPNIVSADTLTWYGTYWLYYQKDTRLTYRYDSVTALNLSRLTSLTDPDGNGVNINYNTDDTIKNITDAAGRITLFEYNANKLCTSMTTPDGRQATYEYSAVGDLSNTTDLLGSSSTFIYDAGHNMTALTVGGKTTSFTKPSGYLWIDSMTDAMGNTTQYGLDSYYNANDVIDPEGGIRRYFNTGGEGYTSGVMDAVGNTSSVSYDWIEGGLPRQFTDANYGYGKGSIFIDYDSNANPTSIRGAHIDENISWVTTNYTYDINDNPITRTNSLGETWNYTYDLKHHMTKIKSPLGNETIMTYDAKGQLSGITDAGDKNLAYTYDSFGNLKTATDQLGNITVLSYDPNGLNIVSMTDARGNTTMFEYDKNDRLTKITNPDETFRIYTYDCCVVISTTDENGHTTTLTRDSLLRVTQITDPFSNTFKLGYDRNTNLTSTTDALNNTTTRTYDAANRLISASNSKGGLTNFTYDKNGNIISLKNEREKTTAFIYGYDNRLLATTDPFNNTPLLKRDALGRVASATNARGAGTAFSYDVDGHVIRKAYDGVTFETYGYDSVGNLNIVIDATGTTTYKYNARREIIGISYPDGKTVSMTYDTVGSLSSVTYPGGLVVHYTYDSRNRISGMSWDGNSIAYTRDGIGNITKETHSNGTESSYAYDANDRIVSIQHSKGTSAFASMAYTRDAVGNTVQETRSLPVSTVITPNTSSVTLNDADQIITRGPDSYTYDADGNLTGITGSQAFSAVYDNENRPVSINRNGVTTTYTYDGTGSRTRAVTEGQTKNYHYDQFGRLLFETDSGGNIAAYYIYSGRRLTAMQTGAGAVYFYHFDKTGNTVALTDSSGNIASAYAYTPTGEVSNSTGFVINPFTYVGAFGVMDEGKGLYFMKARYYEAKTGRFIQKDPIGFAGGINLYAYVGNNPVESVDPSGLNGVGSTFSDFMSGFNWSRGPAGKIIMENPHVNTSPVDFFRNRAIALKNHIYATEGASGAAAAETATATTVAGEALGAMWAAIGAWAAAGQLVETFGAAIKSESVTTTGIAMKETLCNPDYWDMKNFKKEWGHFGLGLKAITQSGWNKIKNGVNRGWKFLW